MSTDRSEAIQIKGLKELQQELRRLDFGGELRKANLKAAEVVATSARSRAGGAGGVLRKTAPSIKAAAEQRAAKVNLGGPSYPWAMGAEFGGRGRPTTQQFKPWRGPQGYALYPAIRATKPEFMDVYEKAIEDLFRRAFPD